MNRATYMILFVIILISIGLAIGINFWAKLYEEIECKDLLGEIVGERTDLIVSDRVPIGCFLPPDISEVEFNNLKSELKNKNEILWNYCFNLGKEDISWDLIGNKLPHGVKVDGYCYNCDDQTCLCLNEDLGSGDSSQRRSLDFREEQSYTNNKCSTKPFADISGVPSVFVVNSGEEPKLSLYAGIKLTGRKRLIGATGALYNGSTRISEVIPKDNMCTSCYGRKWDCYKVYKNEVYCECHLNKRCYGEDPTQICKNYCDVDASASDISFCKLGCDIGYNRYKFRECYAETSEKERCEEKYDCDGDGEVVDKDCEEFLGGTICFGLNNDEKKGCEKFLEAEESVFEVRAMNYTIFKIGDLTLLNPYQDYRGLAFAKVNLTIQAQHPGVSCYNINNYGCYFDCRNQYDKSDCEEECNCSTVSMVEDQNPFILCKNYCSSQDGYFGDLVKIKRCMQGCEDADLGKQKDILGKIISDFEEGCDGGTCDTDDQAWNREGDVLSYDPKYFGDSKSVGVFDTCKNLPTFGLVDTSSWPHIEKVIDLTDWNSLGIPYKLFAQGKDDIQYEAEIFVYIVETDYVGVPPPTEAKGDARFSTRECCGGDPDNPKISREDILKIDISGYSGEHKIIIAMPLNREGNLNDCSCDCGITEDKKTTSAGVFVDNIYLSKSKITTLEEIEQNEAYEKGYNKLEDLNNNKVSVTEPYIYKNLYQSIYSNLIYILDWNDPSSSWTYPHGGTDWSKINTPNLNKTIGLNQALKIIEEIYK